MEKPQASSTWPGGVAGVELVDRVEVVDVANGFNVRQQTGGDHECKEVHSHQHGGAGTEATSRPGGYSWLLLSCTSTMATRDKRGWVECP